MDKKHRSIMKTVYAACFAALIFLGTQFVKIPLPLGFFNIGDIFIVPASYFIGGGYAVMASVTGSVLADILSGYAIYAPATLIIKAVMVLIVSSFCRLNTTKPPLKRLMLVVGVVAAEIFMVVGYYLFESMLYGFSGALVSLPGNILQAAAATVVSTVAVLLLEKTRLSEKPGL